MFLHIVLNKGREENVNGEIIIMLFEHYVTQRY